MPSEPKNRPLGERRKKFIAEYLKTLNASQAARNAGYKGRSNTIGQRLLTDVVIQAAISKKLNEVMASEKDTIRAKILGLWQEVAFGVPESNKPQDIYAFRQHQLKASELLAKYAHMLTDKLEVTGKDGGPIVMLNFKSRPRSRDAGNDSN